MSIRDRRDEININCEQKYPGIKNYYLRCVSDEIAHTIRNETLEDTYFLSIDDIQQKYGLNKNEILNVIDMISKESDVLSNRFIKRNIIEFKVKNPLLNDELLISTNSNSDLYNLKENGLSFFNRLWLPGLVYSFTQAKKIACDLITLMVNEKKTDSHKMELLNEYVQNRVELSIEEGVQEDGSPIFIIEKNSMPLLKGSADQLILALGLTDNYFNKSELQSLTSSDLNSVISHYYEHILKEQIEGIIEEQKDHFINSYDLDEDALDDYFDKDIALNDIWQQRSVADPSLLQRNKLNENDIAWICLEADDQLDIAYQLSLQKVIAYES